MTKQLLIYEEIAPVSKERHREWSVKAGDSYEFSKHVNSVPLTAVEFPLAATEFPIVFAPAGDAVVPVALNGVPQEERRNPVARSSDRCVECTDVFNGSSDAIDIRFFGQSNTAGNW